VSGAAYSKHLSPLQRSISLFSETFSRGGFLAIGGVRPHISRLGDGRGTETAVAAFVNRLFRATRWTAIGDDGSRRTPDTGTKDLDFRARIHHAAIARPQNHDRHSLDHRRHSWLSADPWLLDGSDRIAGALL